MQVAKISILVLGIALLAFYFVASRKCSKNCKCKCGCCNHKVIKGFI